MLESDFKDEGQIKPFEIASILWHHKFLIFLCIILSIIFAGNKLSKVQKKFTAKAIFQIESATNSQGLQISEDLGAIAAIAGLGGVGADSTDVLLERMSNQEFIIKAREELSLDKDKYFNTYSPPKKTSWWASKLKAALGSVETSRDHSQYITAAIIRNYLANVLVSKTEAGAIQISFTHENPQKAADYANGLMQIVKNLINKEKETASNERLAYLSETLADALQEMETTEQLMKEFSLNNSIRADENFVFSSLKLAQLRLERKEVLDISLVLNVIQSLINKDNLNSLSYKNLRATYPLIDSVKFRQILGMSETISDWTWPTQTTVDAVLATLSNRIQRLAVEISDMESDAALYASSAEKMAKLKRDSQIAAATYTVLIEQVKSQALVAGFKPNTFRTFTYASPPLSPSSPKTVATLAVASLIGMLIGFTLSGLNALLSNVFYSRFTMIDSAQPIYSMKPKKLRQISRKPFNEINKLLSSIKAPELEEATIGLSRSNIVFVMNLGSRLSVAGMARVLALRSASTGKKVALIDLSQDKKDSVIEEDGTDKSTMIFGKPEFGVSILKITDETTRTTFFTSQVLMTKMQEFLSKFDQIFIFSSDKEAFSRIRALEQLNPAVVLLSKVKKTRKKDVQILKQIRPIEIMFHD